LQEENKKSQAQEKLAKRTLLRRNV